MLRWKRNPSVPGFGFQIEDQAPGFSLPWLEWVGQEIRVLNRRGEIEGIWRSPAGFLLKSSGQELFLEEDRFYEEEEEGEAPLRVKLSSEDLYIQSPDPLGALELFQMKEGKLTGLFLRWDRMTQQLNLSATFREDLPEGRLLIWNPETGALDLDCLLIFCVLEIPLWKGISYGGI